MGLRLVLRLETRLELGLERIGVGVGVRES